MESKFLEICRGKYSKKDLGEFEKAMSFAQEILKGKKRLSGESYFEHNLGVGGILAEAKLFPEVVVAGLLYGLEDEVVPSEIQEKFGKDVADLVFGQIQLKVIREQTKCAEAEILRKVLLTTLKDIRIIFVKLADKLENLKTISVFPSERQKQIVGEVFEIYAPLANRLGVDFIRKKLEDRAFKIINPRKYRELENFLQESKQEREIFVEKFIEEIKKLLKGKNILKIKGREKQIYSIYKKLQRTTLKNQRDHFAIRIITKSAKDCYNVLGLIHENYEPLEGSLKDYISNPKPNGYQSLHTAIKTKKEKIVEVQIRTLEMDEISEEGSASHWSYKKLNSDFEFEKKTGWLKNVLDLPGVCKDSKLMKNIKLNIFGNKIFCYSPKGKAIELPEKASLLDFAYSIHQEIGDKSVGGRINGIFSGLQKELNNGDVVEIITNKIQRPRRDWLKFVVSGRARSKIKRGLKRYENLPAPKKIPMKNREKEELENVVLCEEFPHANLILAKCCSPTPKDDIVGVMKTQRIFSVHKKDCPEIQRAKDKFVQVFWKETFNAPLKIHVQARDRSGILADILNTIISGGFIVKEAKIKSLEGGIAGCSFVVVPKELNEVVRMIERIKKVRGVRKIWFG